MMRFALDCVKKIQKTATGWVVICGMCGYFAIHPMVMITSRMMAMQGAQHEEFWGTVFVHPILAAYDAAMLPWGIGFAILSSIAGFLYAQKRKAQAREAKLQGVMELAGAACHELNQPLQVVLGYADLLSKDLSQADPLREELTIIIEQIDKMNLILKRIRAITKYETLDYIDGIKIIDIEKSSNLVGNMKQERSRN